MSSNNSSSQRPIPEMVVALKRHLGLLQDYAGKAFVEKNLDYGGEIAGKLRLLVTRFGTNKPLLLDLMRETGIEPTITLGGPPLQREEGKPGAGDEVTLAQYLQLDAVGVRVPSGEFVMLSKTQLIRAWAQQAGSAHEDWSLEPALAALLHHNIWIGGIPAALMELKVTTETVLQVSSQFLTQFEA